MKKSVILAFVAVATSLALYAGTANKKTSVKETTKTECCDKTKCCSADAVNCN